MANLTCKDFERLLDEYEESTLDEAESVSCELHLGTCKDCRDILNQWRSFKMKASTAEPAKMLPLVERKMIVSALSGKPDRFPKESRANWRPVLFASTVALAASVLLFLFMFSNKSGDVGAGGNIELEEVAVPTRDAKIPVIPTRSLLEVNSDIRLWIRAGTKLQVERNDSKEGCFFLANGHIVAEIDKHQPGYRFIVKTPDGQVEATGTIFSVEVVQDKTTEARVLRGTVKVVGKNQTSLESPTYSLSAGQSGVLGEEKPFVADAQSMERDRCLIDGCESEENSNNLQTEVALVSMTPDGHLGEASTKHPIEIEKENSPNGETIVDDADKEKEVRPQNGQRKEDIDVSKRIAEALDHRKSGNYQLAAEIYRQVIDKYPRGEATLSCQVSLGQLELEELGRPNVAASHFARYLKRSPSGFLSEEARFGLVKAHQKTGDQKAIIDACREYIKHHPRGYAGAQVLETLTQLFLKIDDCPLALETAKKLDNSWPGSIESKRIERALGRCAELK